MKTALVTGAWFASAILLTLGGLCLLFVFDVLSQWTILFYRGLLLTAISTSATLVLLLLARRNWPRWHVRDAVSACVVSASVSACFFILIPVTVDRSMSVFMLNQMAAHSTDIFRPQDVQKAFVERYLEEYQEITRRLEEQRASGNVSHSREGYRITAQGIAFMRLARLISAIFGTDPRLVDLNQSIGTQGEPRQ